MVNETEIGAWLSGRSNISDLHAKSATARADEVRGGYGNNGESYELTTRLDPATFSSRPADRSCLSIISTIYSRAEDEKRYAHSLGLAGGWAWLGDFIAPLGAIAVLVLALVLGGLNKQFIMNEMHILGVGIDEDLQIACLGLLNKLIDLLVQYCLEKMAVIYATLWIIQPDVGATVQDVEQLKSELAKPWVAIRNFHRRRRRGIWRFLMCFPVSICVIFLGLGMNTLAWPKKRWYPTKWTDIESYRSDRKWTIQAPLMTLDRADWSGDMDLSLETVGGIPQLDDAGAPIMSAGAADELAGGLSAAGVLSAITRLPGAYSRQPRDWYPVYEGPNFLTGINTDVEGVLTQSISIQSYRITDLFNDQRAGGPSFAAGAMGFTGNVNMTVPTLTTTCSAPTNGTNGIAENGLKVLEPELNSSTFTIMVGPSAGLSFAGVSCAITVSQVMFPVGTWIVDMAPAYAQIHNLSAQPYKFPRAVESASFNAAIASQLAKHTAGILPMLQGFLPAHGIVPHLVLASRQLQIRNTNLASDAAGLGPVLAVVAQHQLTVAKWTQRFHNDTLIPSFPIQWQIYASGPRLGWQWAASAFLVCIIFAMAELVRLVLKHRLSVDNFLTLGGVLRMANATDELDIVKRTRAVEWAEKKREKAEEDMDASFRFAVCVADGKKKLPLLIEVGSIAEGDSAKQKSRDDCTSSLIPT